MAATISKVQPIAIDFKKKRGLRQHQNYALVSNSIKGNNKKEFYENINHKTLHKLLDNTGLDFSQFWEKCTSDEIYCKTASMPLSKCSSRQGCLDEKEQLNACNETSHRFGIDIIKLTSRQMRPSKDGHIFTQETIKEKKINLNSCLKSFDGKIQGNMSGFITSKITYANGGHQDNVFAEIYTLCDWWNNYKASDTNEYLIALIETDLSRQLNDLKEKYITISNIKIFSHIEFQQYMIDNYESCDNM